MPPGAQRRETGVLACGPVAELGTQAEYGYGRPQEKRNFGPSFGIRGTAFRGVHSEAELLPPYVSILSRLNKSFGENLPRQAGLPDFCGTI